MLAALRLRAFPFSPLRPKSCSRLCWRLRSSSFPYPLRCGAGLPYRATRVAKPKGCAVRVRLNPESGCLTHLYIYIDSSVRQVTWFPPVLLLSPCKMSVAAGTRRCFPLSDRATCYLTRHLCTADLLGCRPLWGVDATCSHCRGHSSPVPHTAGTFQRTLALAGNWRSSSRSCAL